MPRITPRVAVVTVSDGVSAGTRVDGSGDAIRDWVRERGFELAESVVVPDARQRIGSELERLADDGAADVIITTGGTGFTVRDVTPEATLDVVTRHAPGIAEQIRARGLASTPYSMLSRGIAGIRGTALIVNLPGSTGGVRDGLQVLDDIILHAVQLLRGIDTEQH